jgi:tetratricopeptide (TPR) repeat protein
MNLLTQAGVSLRYLGLLIFPAGLNVDHDIRLSHSLFEPATAAAVAAVVALVVTGIVLVSKRDLLGICILWYFVALAPSSSVIPRLEHMLEYRVYLASLGFAGAVVWTLHSLKAWLSRRASADAIVHRVVVPGLFIVIVAVMSSLTLYRNNMFRDPVRLWSDAVMKSPHKPRVLNNLGVSLANHGATDEAKAHLIEAVRLSPNDADFRNNLGTVLADQGLTDEAIFQYRCALDINHNSVEAYNNLGIILAKQGDIEEAIRQFQNALRLAPNDAEVKANIAEAMAGKQKK